MPDLETIALFRHLPQLRGVVPWAPLGEWPTPVEAIEADGTTVWVKREDVSSPHYGGNKVRTVEAHAGLALARGCPRIWSTGAFGSNHATATLIHAPRVGLQAGAMLFEQPATSTAKANLRAMAATGGAVSALWSPITLPWGIIARRRSGDYVMTPGGATPVGALGHVSAGLELAEQVEAGELPAPTAIYLAVGSTCTSAGLLVGLHLAAKLGIGFGPGRSAIPRVLPVRVTPWPFTSTTAVQWLARWTAARLAELVGDAAAIDTRKMAHGVSVQGGFLGRGYGYPTESGRQALTLMRDAGGPKLDLVYSGKAAAGMSARHQHHEGPALFWATKSTAPLPEPTDEQLAALPATMGRWLRSPNVA